MLNLNLEHDEERAEVTEVTCYAADIQVTRIPDGSTDCRMTKKRRFNHLWIVWEDEYLSENTEHITHSWRNYCNIMLHYRQHIC